MKRLPSRGGEWKRVRREGKVERFYHESGEETGRRPVEESCYTFGPFLSQPHGPRGVITGDTPASQEPPRCLIVTKKPGWYSAPGPTRKRLANCTSDSSGAFTTTCITAPETQAMRKT